MIRPIKTFVAVQSPSNKISLQSRCGCQNNLQSCRAELKWLFNREQENEILLKVKIGFCRNFLLQEKKIISQKKASRTRSAKKLSHFYLIGSFVKLALAFSFSRFRFWHCQTFLDFLCQCFLASGKLGVAFKIIWNQ